MFWFYKMLDLMVADPLNVAALLLFVAVLLFTEYRPSWWLNKNPFIGFKNQKRQTKVPGPPALPFIGTRWLYYTGYYKFNKIHELYQDLFKKYGPVVKEEALWNFPVFSLYAPKDIEKVLMFPSRYPVRPPSEVQAFYRNNSPDKFTTMGLTNEQGKTWHNLRTSLTPTLTSAATMQRFLPELNQVAEDFIRLLMSSKEGKGVVHSFERLASRMGLETTCTLVLGRRMAFLEKEMDTTSARLAYASDLLLMGLRDTNYGLPFWKYFPTTAYNQVVESEEITYEVVSEMVDSALKEQLETCEMDAVKSVFMSILQAPSLDVKDKKAGVIDFVAGGIKTLGNTLVFLMYHVAKSPQAQSRLYNEIISLAPPGTPIDAQVLRDAHYLRACVKESFRVLPTAPWVARILEADMELSGHNLKSGSVVLCHTWVAGLQEQNFKRPKKFLPERWLNEPCPCQTSQSGTSQEKQSPSLVHIPHTSPTQNQPSLKSKRECICDVLNSHINPILVSPFGVGKRQCPGKRFVELALQVVLAQTVRQFEVNFDGELDLQFEFILSPGAKTNFIFKDRH